MNCVILSESAGFPWGMAASSRVRNIGKALLDQGAGVQYIGLRGANVTPDHDVSSKGFHHGIAYHYPGGFAVRPGKWTIRRIDDLLGKWGAVRQMRRRIKAGKVDIVILYTRDPEVVDFWSDYCHRNGIPVVLEVCEWPEANTPEGIVPPERARRYCRESVTQVDAVLPISTYIEDKIRSALNEKGKTIPVFRIPILFDRHETNGRDATENRVTTPPYMLYSGSVQYMDIARLVIDIVRILQDRGIQLPLKFTGGGQSHLYEELRTYAREQNVEQAIEFTGYLDEQVLENYIRDAFCLLAPLPDNAQSRARFPTKTGYYLSSANPVVTNDIGSVSEYLLDDVNACVAGTAEAGDLAGKIEELIRNPDWAKKIGEAGRKLAFDRFYYKNGCRGLRDFLEQLAAG